jgi:hypothetical protein
MNGLGRLIAGLAVAACSLSGAAASAQTPPVRLTLWNLKLGTALEALPPVEAFKGYACGSNGGPPRQQIRDWSEFAKCRAEPSGLREVYFEYDDEREYIARALEITNEIARWAGTTEQGFPVIVSALFDERGTVRGLRMVSDPRPDSRTDNYQSDNRTRSEAYVIGGMLAARFDIEAKRDCKSLPPAEGESPVGDLFVKQVCERIDEKNGRRIALSASYFRKPGQLAYNPLAPNELTQGQFESSARLEVVLLPDAR